MTGDRDSHGIGRARARDGSSGARPADCRCNLSIRARLSARNGGERIPDLPLKRRGPDVKRQFQPWCAARQMCKDLRGPSRNRALVEHDRRSRVFRLERAREISVALAHCHGTDAPFGARDKQASQRRSNDRVSDVHPRTAGLVAGRRHAEPRGGTLIESAARPVACVKKRRCHSESASEPLFHFLEPRRVGILSRCDADEPLEISLEVIWTAAQATGQPRERRMPLDVGEIHARAADLVDPGIGANRIAWSATLARTVARGFSLGRRREELNARPVRLAAWARRSAVHTGRSDGINKMPIRTTVARDHSPPLTSRVPVLRLKMCRHAVSCNVPPPSAAIRSLRSNSPARGRFCP